MGLSRAHELLTTKSPSDLSRRLLTALAWAGRAAAEPRADQAYLDHAIALESLLGSESRGGLTDRLRLRLAHLIGGTSGARREAHAIMGKLYFRRSMIVHQGDDEGLTEIERKRIRMFARCALTVVLTHRPFIKMTRVSEFEQWLDERLLFAPRRGSRATS
jgi:hypothetical protein